MTIDLHDIDHDATNASSERLPRDHLGILKMVQQGATWSKQHTAASGYHDNTFCDLCGEPNQSNTHTIWTCSALEDIRRIELQKIDLGLDPEHLHPALLHGIAPTMSACYETTFWGKMPQPYQALKPLTYGAGRTLEFPRHKHRDDEHDT